MFCSINYNNIEYYSSNSIYLQETFRETENVDASNNWWGTTDTQAIDLTIHDFKYNLTLSKVTFMPILTEPNIEAIPIPEFPSWIILPFFLIGILAVILMRKKI